MKKLLVLVGISILLVTASASANSHTELIKAFVSFDQAFIPPLAITNQEKVKPSKKAMAILNQNWSEFKPAYENYNPTDPNWKKDFEYADAQIKKANGIVDSGKDLFSAHETLESVRIQFKELRRRNNIDYFLDYLTEFHEYMEAIFHAGKDNAPESLTDDDIDDLNNHRETAAGLWQKINTLPFDSSLYGFNDQKTGQMKAFMAAETEALNRLKKAIQSKDNTKIVKACMGIKPNYAKLYKMFGDFERVKKG